MIRKTILAIALGAVFAAPMSNVYAEGDEEKKSESQLIISEGDDQKDEKKAELIVAEGDEEKKADLILSEGDEEKKADLIG